MTTVSDDGFPHHVFLSEDEWARRDDGRVALALLASSRTAANLRRRGEASLLSLADAAPGTTALLRRGRPRRLASDPARRVFTFDVVREVPARTLPGERAWLTGSLAYERAIEPEDAERRARIQEELQR